MFFVSLEQSRIELAERLLCCQARVDSHQLRKGHLGADDMDKLIAGRRRAAARPSCSSTTRPARACCASPPTPAG